MDKIPKHIFDYNKTDPQNPQSASYLGRKRGDYDGSSLDYHHALPHQYHPALHSSVIISQQNQFFSPYSLPLTPNPPFIDYMKANQSTFQNAAGNSIDKNAIGAFENLIDQLPPKFEAQSPSRSQIPTSSKSDRRQINPLHHSDYMQQNAAATSSAISASSAASSSFTSLLCNATSQLVNNANNANNTATCSSSSKYTTEEDDKKAKMCPNIKLERGEFSDANLEQSKNEFNLEPEQLQEETKKENKRNCVICYLEVDLNSNNAWRDLHKDFTTTSFIKLWDIINDIVGTLVPGVLPKKKVAIVCQECFQFFDKIDELQQLLQVSFFF